MLEFYPQIKHAHIAAALLSGSLFAIRGGCMLGGARWPVAPPVRWLSYAIDTALLTAALMLFTILPGGVFALRRARSRRGRASCYAGALLVFLCIYGTARAHSPLGAWLWWFG